MDLTDALRYSENALRDFIAATFRNLHGEGWELKGVIQPRMIKKWDDERQRETSKQASGVVEPRLIYYADFHHVVTIVEDHWVLFGPALGTDWPTMRVWLDALRSVRNQEAH